MPLGITRYTCFFIDFDGEGDDIVANPDMESRESPIWSHIGNCFTKSILLCRYNTFIRFYLLPRYYCFSYTDKSIAQKWF